MSILRYHPFAQGWTCHGRVFDGIGLATRVSRPALCPVLLQQVRLLAVDGELRSYCLEALRVSPRTAESSIAERHEHADSNHARTARFLVGGRGVDEGAEAGVAFLVDKVNQVIGNGVQARRQRLVFDDALELEAWYGLLPYDCVASFDVKVDQEQGGYGGQVGEKPRCSRGHNRM